MALHRPVWEGSPLCSGDATQCEGDRIRHVIGQKLWQCMGSPPPLMAYFSPRHHWFFPCLAHVSCGISRDEISHFIACRQTRVTGAPTLASNTRRALERSENA